MGRSGALVLGSMGTARIVAVPQLMAPFTNIQWPYSYLLSRACSQPCLPLIPKRPLCSDDFAYA